MFIGDGDEPVGLLERALAATIEAEPIERKIGDAVRSGIVESHLAPGEGAAELAAGAMRAGVITKGEEALLNFKNELTAAAIRVDDFDRDLGVSLLVGHADDDAERRPRAPIAIDRAVA
jgi:acyl-CoA dehydrogenase